MLTFQKAGLTDLVIEGGRSLPITTELTFNQERVLTEDRQPKVVDYGGDIEQLYQVNLENLSVKDFRDLKAWFSSSQVNGALNNFTMIDEDGTSLTVRLWSDKVTLTMNAFGVYSASFLLRGE